MSFTSTIVVAAVVLGVVQLVLGIAIGRALPRGTRVGRSACAPNAVDLRNLTRRLYRLVTSVAYDVGEHQTRIERVGRELASMQAPDAAPLTGVFLNTVAQAMRVNERLQDRLSAAETRLQAQTRLIESHLNEARTDPLTGLPNRRAFDDELVRRVAEWRRKRTTFCLMMLDVDHFKALNDRYGHPAGDCLLRDVAELLKNTLREMDFVARVGGEEFAVIFPSTSSHDAKRATERVRATLAAHEFRIKQVALQMTISLGLAAVQVDEDPASLVRRADEALYASKRAGRNCGHFHTGETCQPISSGVQPGRSRPNEPDQSNRDDVLQTVGDDLESQFVEVTGQP